MGSPQRVPPFGMIGKKVSHYQVLQELGVGGMGIVYKAEDKSLDRFVALKFLPQGVDEDGHALDRFRREAKAASSLNHPKICTIYEIGDHEGQPFIAMEYLDGQTLERRIHGQPLDTGTWLDFAIQIAEALEAAHLAGVVHRDIKPANIFVTKNRQVKVLDFGVAKFDRTRPRRTGLESSTEGGSSTSGCVVGTVEYMSPEQALGRAIDCRSDLFSFGVVLYEMATGRAPFRGTTTGAVFNSILHNAPVSPSRLNPDLPEEIENVIKKALEKDCQLRYQSATEICTDLRRLRRKTEAEISGLVEIPEDFSWRERARAMASRSLPFVALGMVILVTVAIAASQWSAISRLHRSSGKAVTATVQQPVELAAIKAAAADSPAAVTREPVVDSPKPLEKPATHPTAPARRIAELRSEGHAQAAVQTNCTADGFHCSDIPDLLAKSEAAAGRGDYSRARYEYGVVLRLDPRNTAAREGLRKVEEAEKLRH